MISDPAEEEKVWGAKPRVIDYEGRTLEVFTRNALALALNRKIVTIRSLEARGILCHPRLRDGRGIWLYTRDQIRDIVALADQEQVLNPNPRNSFTEHFAREARRIIRRLPK